LCGTWPPLEFGSDIAEPFHVDRNKGHGQPRTHSLRRPLVGWCCRGFGGTRKCSADFDLCTPWRAHRRAGGGAIRARGRISFQWPYREESFSIVDDQDYVATTKNGGGIFVDPRTRGFRSNFMATSGGSTSPYVGPFETCLDPTDPKGHPVIGNSMIGGFRGSRVAGVLPLHRRASLRSRTPDESGTITISSPISILHHRCVPRPA